MIETAVVFVIALGIIVLAQVAEIRNWARWALYSTLLALGVASFAAGAIVLTAPSLMKEFGRAVHGVGFWGALMVIGLMVFAPAAMALMLQARGRASSIWGVPWTRPVHLTAWSLLVMFIGSNIAVATVESLSDIELKDPLALILLQNTAFTLAALLGVGWGVRRNWRETAQRLGLTPPMLHEFFVGAAMAVLMLFSTAIVGGLVALAFGEDLSASANFNQQILRQLPGIGGVLFMGLATGVGEEMLYRGALQPVAGLWLTSLLFAASHFQYLSPAIFVIFVLGALLGYTRDKWGLNTSIWAHAVYNILVGLIALAAMQFQAFTPGM